MPDLNLNLTLTAAGAALLASSLTFVGHRLFFVDEPVAAAPAGPGIVADGVRDLRDSFATFGTGQKELRRVLRELRGRVDELEVNRSRAVAVDPTDSVAPAGSQPAAVVSGRKPLSPDAFEKLLTKVLRASMSDTASDADQTRFWEAARKGNHIATLMKKLQGQVEERPNDADLRIQLADAYVAKLLTVPSGPERGVWGMRAEREWKEALDIDENHWDAQYSLAFNYSMYPDFLNKTEDAIQGFQKLLAIQEKSPREDRHAKGYLGLARMYKKKGELDKAVALMRDAESLFPKDKQVARSLRDLLDAQSRGKR